MKETRNETKTQEARMRWLNARDTKDLAAMEVATDIVAEEKGWKRRVCIFWQVKNKPEIMRVYFGKEWAEVTVEQMGKILKMVDEVVNNNPDINTEYFRDIEDAVIEQINKEAK